MNDHYATLGVTRDADAATIKAAYKKLAKIHHPDTHPDDPHAATRMALINDAYAVLSDDEKRKHYDATGEDKKPDVELAAYGHFLQAMGNVLQARGSNLRLFDHVRQTITHDIQMAQLNVQKGEEVIETIKRAVSRIRYKGSREDVATKMLQEQIEKLEQQLRAARHGRAVVEMALLIAEDYEYNYEEPQRPTWAGTIFVTTGT